MFKHTRWRGDQCGARAIDVVIVTSLALHKIVSTSQGYPQYEKFDLNIGNCIHNYSYT